MEQDTTMTDEEIDAVHQELDDIDQALTAEEEKMINSTNLSIR